MSASKEKYTSLCRTEDVPVFLQDWWLDAVCQHEWDVVLVEDAGQIRGAFVYRKTQRWGQTLFNMPALTSNWGPWIKYPADQKYSSRLSYEHQILSELISALPAFGYFNQRFRYAITNGLPFFWKGFSLTTRYTYVIESLTAKETVWDNLGSSARSQIRKAEKVLTVTEATNTDDLFRLSAMIFDRQKIKTPYSAMHLKRIHEACKAHQSGKIFQAVDSSNKVQSCLLLVWDKQSAYYVAGGTEPDAPGGAFSLLMWRAIEHAAHVTREFNFEGSMLESVERFFRTFGPVQKSYLQVQKVNSTAIKLGRAAGVI